MKIAVINASSQKEKNDILFEKTQKAASKHGHEVMNLGVFSYEPEEYSYIQMALCASVLLSSEAADFVVTGCSSGTGMMLACNSLPNVICGYVNNPTEAYLFGRINAGNAISFPLGLQYGWAGEVNLEYTLEKLFAEPFGTGYPPQDAERKMQDTQLLKAIKNISNVPLANILEQLDEEILQTVFSRKEFSAYVTANGKKQDVVKLIEKYRQG